MKHRMRSGGAALPGWLRGGRAELGSATSRPARRAATTYVALVTALGATLTPGVAAAQATEPTTHQVSDSPTSTDTGGHSNLSDMTPDGSMILFGSRKSDFVPNDTNGVDDLFLRDRRDGSTVRVNVSSTGGQSADVAGLGAISADGRVVAFQSVASDLVSDPPGLEHGRWRAYARDLSTGTTELVSVSSAGEPAAGSTEQVDISDDGRFVVFRSAASNLVAGDSNRQIDVFLRDRELGETTRVSIDENGGEANGHSFEPSISGDGSRVAFVSTASFDAADTNALPDVYVKDLGSGRLELVSSGPGVAAGSAGHPSLSRDGGTVAFESTAALVAEDRNGTGDIYVHQLASHSFERASSAHAGDADGYSSTPAISGTGRFVSFDSTASNLVSPAVNRCLSAMFDPAYRCPSTFIYDRRTQTTERVSVDSPGPLGYRESFAAHGSKPSDDGRFVAFTLRVSPAYGGNVFLRDRGTSADSQAPLVNGSFDRSPASSGWHNSDVTIDWQAAEPSPSSGAPTDPPDTIASIEGRDVVYTSEPSCDPARNCATGSVTVSIDRTPPLVTATASPAPNGDGWHRSHVVVEFTCEDALSGIASCPASQTIAGEAAGQRINGTAVDRAGNETTVTLTGINVDLSAPSITAAISPESNAAGWHDGPVAVSFTCADAVSSVKTCSAPVTLSADGVDQEASGMAVDAAGNESSLTVSGIDVDSTAPALSFSGNNGVYAVGEQLDIGCAAFDALSGLDVSDCRGVSGPAYEYVGVNELFATATDVAGNVSTATTRFEVVVDAAGINDVVDAFVSNSGIATGLEEKIDGVRAAIASGNDAAAAGKLRAFENEVRAQVGKSITSEEAAILIELGRTLVEGS